MNFMDFSDDACLHMFTPGQKQRIHDLFAVSAPRESMLRSAALNKPWNTSTSTELQTDGSLHLSIFPNPASTFITLQFNNEEQAEPGTYRIYNATGRLVVEGNNTSGRTVYINTLPAGIYLIKLQRGSRVLTAKFVKQ